MEAGVTSQQMQETDIAVVGGGPAGLSAGTAAAEAGARVTVLEAAASPGGSLGVQAQPLQGPDGLYRGLTGIQLAGAMARSARDSGVAILTGAPVWGLESPLVLAYTHEGAKRRLRAKRLVVATGSTDGVTAFPGWTLPGVMLAGALQRMVNIHRVLPGGRVLVLGCDNAGVFVANDLLSAGAEVKGIVEQASDPPASVENVSAIKRAGVPLYHGHRILRAEGDERVETAVIVPVADGEGRPNGGSEQRIDVDMICLATHREPRWDLAALAGAQSLHAGIFGGFVPVRDRDMRMERGDAFVAGDAAGVESGAAAIIQGLLAGIAAAADLGHRHPREPQMSDQARRDILGLRTGTKGRARQEASDRIEAAWAPAEGAT